MSRLIQRPQKPLNEIHADIPDPGEPVRTQVQAVYRKRVWSLARKPEKDALDFWAVWRYPTVGLWKKLKKYDESREQEDKAWRYLLLDTSLIAPVVLEGNQLSDEAHRKIMEFWPGMVPIALLRQYLETTVLSHSELLRIERDCYSLWTNQGGVVKNPHPILADVIWAMSLYEHFGVQLWERLDDMHVKIYAVMKKVMECYSMSMNINIQSVEQRKRAQQLSGVGPGGVVGQRY
jgi:hypothetical protein